MTSHPTLVLQSPSRLVFLPRVVHTPGKLTGQTDKVLKCGGNPASHGYSILQSILPNSRALQHAIVVLVSTLHQGHGALLWVGTTKHWWAEARPTLTAGNCKRWGEAPQSKLRMC
jgi:hypothetical protein